MGEVSVIKKQLSDFQTMSEYGYDFYVNSGQILSLIPGNKCKVVLIFHDITLLPTSSNYPNPVVISSVYTATSTIDLSQESAYICTYTTSNAFLDIGLHCNATIYFNL